MMKIQNPCYRLLTVATLALAGCGGGSTPALDKTVSFSGVAAVGAPMADAVITVRDATGAIFTTTADATGAYSFTNIAVTAPLQLQATAVMGDSNVTHYAVLPSLDAIRLVNVTPLTTAVASLISTSDIAAPMTAASIAALSATNIALATANINTVIKPMLTALSLPSNFNPMTSALTANGQDADLLLDHLNVAVRPTGVTISNRMATPTDDANSTSANASVISKTLATRPTALSNATVTATDGFVALATKLQACFAINESLRLSNRTTATATLHADCQGIASATYLHNGTPFINRWATELNSSAFTGATFSKPVLRLKTKDAPERFSVNFNYKDNTGVGYTRPESIEKQADGSWLLAGNGKSFNFYPEAFLQYFDDVSTLPYNNTNYSVVESGVKLSLDPRFAFTASGAVSYPALDMTDSSGRKTTGTSGYFKTLAAALPAGSKMVGCVIVSGPGALNGAKWSGFHPNGVMMKRPDASNLQDYLAIDSIPSNAWRTAINAAKGAATGNLGVGRNVTEGSNTNICTQSGKQAGSDTTLTSSAATIWETSSSRSLYTVEIEALGARTNVLTGATNDTTIAGRNVAWNTYVAYAREAPSAELSAVFDNNPLVTFEVFDTDGKLRAVYSSRLIGEVPPAIMAKAYVENNMVSKMDSATLSRYLNFAGNTATTQETQTTFTGTWTMPNGAFALDRVMLYSRIEKSETGPGLVASSSLWTSDPDLAATLNAITGTNFVWRNNGWARPTGTTSCSGDFLISTTSFNVSRTTLSVVSSSLDGQYYGGNQLASACIAATNSSSAPTKANVYRELGTRTYTDTNTRLHYYVSNKALR